VQEKSNNNINDLIRGFFIA